MDQLRQLQLVELEMLKVFDRVCRKHGVPYFVSWGTALGAVRHKGFIPWDDDIDVCMLRKDFDALLKIPEEEWEGLELAMPGETPFYQEKWYPKLFKPGTIFESKNWIRLVGEQAVRKPVWIDIFLFDYYDTEEEAKRKTRTACRYHWLYYHSKFRNNINRDDPIREKAVATVKNVIYHILRMFSTPEGYISGYYRKIRKDQGKHLICYDDLDTKEITDSKLDESDIFPLQDIQFEDMTVMTARDTDKELRQLFGDYMQLPPEEERVGHLPQHLGLGD